MRSMSQYENNTQRSAALKYNGDSSSAPIVVASGLGYVAQKIIDLAQENEIPVYQDDALASLLTQLECGSEIPPELYQAVVDIYVYFLNYNQKDLEISENSENLEDEFQPLLQEPPQQEQPQTE